MPVVCTQQFAKITSISFLIFLSVGILFAMGLGASPVTAAPSDLFFSEYVEGSGSNKALEIFNGTGTTIDLSVYSIELYSNGSSTVSQSVNLSGKLSDGDVFVLAHGSAVVTITNVADLINNAVINFNGDDTIVLRRSGLIIDVIGQIGVDPGAEWGSGLTSTANNTLRRKSSIEGGDANENDPFDPVGEWEGFPQNTFDDLGSHNIGPPPPLPSPGDVIINEVAWAGTIASNADEWIELLNTTTQTITLTGWAITSTNGLKLPLDGTTIGPGGYYVIERSDDNAIIDVAADLARSFGSGLANGGDTLFLSTGGVSIDTANADGGPWPAGISSAAGNFTMERNDPFALETDAAWTSNKGCRINGLDAEGNPIFGTPAIV